MRKLSSDSRVNFDTSQPRTNSDARKNRRADDNHLTFMSARTVRRSSHVPLLRSASGVDIIDIKVTREKRGRKEETSTYISFITRYIFYIRKRAHERSRELTEGIHD